MTDSEYASVSPSGSVPITDPKIWPVWPFKIAPFGNPPPSGAWLEQPTGDGPDGWAEMTAVTESTPSVAVMVKVSLRA